MNNYLGKILLILIVISSLSCESTIKDEDGKEICLDEYISKAGKDRSKIETEAKSRGIEASAVILELHRTVTGIADIIFDCSASQNYTALAEQTSGKYIKATSSVKGMEEIQKYTVAMTQDSIDMVFLVDGTGSMYDDIQDVKNKLSTLITSLSGKYVRISIVLYRDNNVDSVWYERNTHNFVNAGDQELSSFLSGVQAFGGGDFPESMYDAAYKTISELQWASKGRLLIVLTDAAPLTGAKTHYTGENIITLCIEKKVVPFVVLVSLK